MVFNINNPPGFSSTIESHESEVVYGGRRGFTQVSERAIVIGSDAEDAGNSPTTSLRGGLMIIENSSGVHYPFGQTDEVGPIRGILPFTIDMMDVFGITSEKWVQIFTSGLLKTNEVIDAGRHEFNTLAALGFVLDEPLLGDPVGRTFSRTIQAGDAAYVADSYDFSSLIVVANDSVSRAVTLPDIEENGYIAVLCGAGGGTIQSVEGGNMIDGGVATADSVTTAGMVLLEFVVVMIGSTLAWAVMGGDAA